MNTTTFDTLSAARSLEAAGIEAKQAEAIVQAIRSSGESRGHKNRSRSHSRRIARRDQRRREQDVAGSGRHCRTAICSHQDIRLDLPLAGAQETSHWYLTIW